MIRGAVAAVAVAAGLCGLAASASAQMFGLSNIQNWTGTGSNQAALVIDWNDGKGPESIAWGFRWNGTATGLDMFRAIDLADPRLALFPGTDPTFGTFVYGIGYDLNGNGGTFTPGTPRSNETGGASDPGDHYAEGFFSKYWAYYNSDTGSPYGGGGAWAFGDNGAAGRTLVNGSWDGYSISDANFDASNPGFPSPAAVPEPAAGLRLACGAVAACLAWRRKGFNRARV